MSIVGSQPRSNIRSSIQMSYWPSVFHQIQRSCCSWKQWPSQWWARTYVLHGKADSALSGIPGSSLEKSHFWWRYPCGGLVICWTCCGLKLSSPSRWSLSIQRRKLPIPSILHISQFISSRVVSCSSGQLSKTGGPLIVPPSVGCLLPTRQGWSQFWLSKRMAASMFFGFLVFFF